MVLPAGNSLNLVIFYAVRFLLGESPLPAFAKNNFLHHIEEDIN